MFTAILRQWAYWYILFIIVLFFSSEMPVHEPLKFIEIDRFYELYKTHIITSSGTKDFCLCNIVKQK